MTLTQLRTFLAVADTGSVHGAAQHLYVTQSAVSASLTALQKSLGIRLIQREGRGLRLTDAGAVYADYLRRVLGLLDEATTAAAAEDDPEHGVLRIAAVTTAGEQILPRLLTSFRKRHPQIGIQLEVGNHDRVAALLDRREVDLLLCGRPNARRKLAILGVRAHELIVVAPDGSFTSSDTSDLTGWANRQTWLLREKGSSTREATLRYLEALDLPHAPRCVTVGSNAAIREAVAAGLGVTILSRDAVLRELADQSLMEVPLRDTPLPRDWHLVANPGTVPATATALVAHVLMTGEFHRPSLTSAPAVRDDRPEVHHRRASATT